MDCEDSEDSELSDDHNEMIPAEAIAEFQDIDNSNDSEDIPEDIPLDRLFGLPANSVYLFKNEGNLVWTESKTSRDPQENIFQGEPNPPKSILQLEGHYNLFKFFILDEFLSKVVEQTCLYSAQVRPEKPIHVDSKELEQFLGILVWMANMRQHSTRRYWAPETRIPQIANIMSLHRFEQIKRFLHFSDNSKVTKNTDKIMPLVDQIKACPKVPFEEHLSCDEQIIPFKARSALKTYNPKKPHKWGYKMYVLSGVSGFTSNFELCSSNNDTSLMPGEPNLGATSNIIVPLCRPVTSHINHKVYYDNYFSSLSVLSYLDKMGIKTVATVRSNRLKGLKTVTEKEMRKKGRGSLIETTATVNGVDIHCVQWFDNRQVSLISTFAGTEPLTKVSRYFKSENTRRAIDCPDIVTNYNMHMGGVDLQDSLLGLIFCHMLDFVIVNAWLLMRRINKQLNKNEKIGLLQFKTILARDLCWVGKTVDKKRGRPSTSTPTNSRTPVQKRKCLYPRSTNNIRSDNIGHWPSSTENRQRCKNPNCKGKSRIICEKCNIHLCLYKTNNCFKKFHCNE